MRIKGSFAAGGAALLVLCGIVSLASGFHFTQLQTCTNNLRSIASAKGSYGLENKLPPGDRVAPGKISPLLIRGWQALRCPSGGQYEPGLFTGDKDHGDVRHAPACSVHGSLARLDSASRGFFAVPRPYFVLSLACIGLAAFAVLGYQVGSRRSWSQPSAARHGGPAADSLTVHRSTTRW
jgi:hypothetical protein